MHDVNHIADFRNQLILLKIINFHLLDLHSLLSSNFCKNWEQIKNNWSILEVGSGRLRKEGWDTDTANDSGDYNKSTDTAS